MNNNIIASTKTNKLYVAHSAKKEAYNHSQIKTAEKVNKTNKATVEPHFYTGKSYSYDGNGGGYKGL